MPRLGRCASSMRRRKSSTQRGVHLVSTDEKTGIQALEQAHPKAPMKPGLWSEWRAST